MKAKAISYRSTSSIKNEFREKGIAVWWKSCGNMTQIPPLQYGRLRAFAERRGVTRIIYPRKVLNLDFNEIPDYVLEDCIEKRAVMPGTVLNLRRIPKRFRRARKSFPHRAVSMIGVVSVRVISYLKVGMTKGDLNVVHYKNSQGKKIQAIVDYPEGEIKDADIPWVVIPPAFGKRKETYFLLALYLKRNGFGVVRYDDTNSIGESDGEIRNTTLGESKENIIATVNFIENELAGKKIGLIPFSLSAHPALRAAREDKRISFVIPVVGSPNLQTLLDRVYGEDLVGDFAAGMRKGDLNLLGHFIDTTNFFSDAQKNNYSDFASTVEDMKMIDVPVIWFCGKNDPWVDPREVIEIVKVGPKGAHREAIVVRDLTHRFREAEMAHEIFAKVTRVVAALTRGEKVKEVVRPRTAEIYERAIRERKRIQTVISEEEKVRLWTNYLDGFGILKETDDYMDYLAEVASKINFEAGEKLLDAGCGNGFLIEFLLGKMSQEMTTAIYKCEPDLRKGGEIFGLDIVREALERASNNAYAVKMKRPGLPKVDFVEHDIDMKRLPFGDWHFDRVAASLLLSYLKNPEEAVGELCRVLKPGGKIVLTSLKPDADVSQIYFRFIQKLKVKCPREDQQKLWKDARDLFNKAVCWIEGKEEEGIFTYFSGSELRRLLEANGISNIKITKSFGGQALIVVGTKPI